jgi:hypothetical protein
MKETFRLRSGRIHIGRLGREDIGHGQLVDALTGG